MRKGCYFIKVQLIAYTPNPEKIVASAAKLCYSKSDIPTLLNNLTNDKINDFLKRLNELGHQSPLEHISFTFGIEGVSRSLSHQLVRHRIASYSQQSQRYVNMSEPKYVTPSIIAENENIKNTYDITMGMIWESYNTVSEQLKTIYMEQGYNTKVAEKKAIENARYVLPNACETKIIVTMNARSLLHFFEERCCNRAQDEIRELANEMLKLVKKICPIIFNKAGASCVRGKCKEGVMSCKNINKNVQIKGQMRFE